MKYFQIKNNLEVTDDTSKQTEIKELVIKVEQSKIFFRSGLTKL